MTGLVSPACECCHRLHSSRPFSWRSASGLAKPRPALEIDDPPAHRTVFRIDHVLPLESVVAGYPSVTARAADERSNDTVTGSDRLALQLAVNHFAALIGPDAASLHARAAFGEADRLGSEADRRPLRSGEQYCSCQFEDSRAIILT